MYSHTRTLPQVHTHTYTHMLVKQQVCVLTYSLTLTHSLVHSLTRSLTHALTHTLTPRFFSQGEHMQCFYKTVPGRLLKAAEKGTLFNSAQVQVHKKDRHTAKF